MRYSKRFCVAPGSKVDLSKVDAGFKGRHETHQDALAEIEPHKQKPQNLQ
jgi:hypothetical protein